MEAREAGEDGWATSEHAPQASGRELTGEEWKAGLGTLGVLPHELRLAIASHLKRAGVRALAACSRAFNDVLLPLLYKEVEISHPSQVAGVLAVIGRMAMLRAATTTSLRVAGHASECSDPNDLRRLFTCLDPMLKLLDIDQGGDMRVKPEPLQALEYLRVVLDGSRLAANAAEAALLDQSSTALSWEELLRPGTANIKSVYCLVTGPAQKPVPAQRAQLNMSPLLRTQPKLQLLVCRHHDGRRKFDIVLLDPPALGGAPAVKPRVFSRLKKLVFHDYNQSNERLRLPFQPLSHVIALAPNLITLHLGLRSRACQQERK